MIYTGPLEEESAYTQVIGSGQGLGSTTICFRELAILSHSEGIVSGPHLSASPAIMKPTVKMVKHILTNSD